MDSTVDDLPQTQPAFIDSVLAWSDPRISTTYLNALTQPRVLNALMLSADPKLLDASLRALAQGLRASAQSAHGLQQRAASQNTQKKGK